MTDIQATGLFSTGIRPLVDDYLALEAAKVRDYGDYWSASNAGYCQRKVIFERLGVPPVTVDARKQRVFSSGHIFHEWIQGITKAAGVSVAQEVELQDEKLMVRGHFDDLVLITTPEWIPDVQIKGKDQLGNPAEVDNGEYKQHLILYDYKTQNSQAFTWAKKQQRGMSHYHTMQLGTYMYMIRRKSFTIPVLFVDETEGGVKEIDVTTLAEARILKISKDDLRMAEEQLLWSPDLEKKVVEYWTTLNGYWREKKIPACTCHLFEVNDKTGKGFMADPRYNPYFYNNQPCSIDWYNKCKAEGLLK